MKDRKALIYRTAISTALLLAVSSCSEDDTRWEVGRSALEGGETNRERVDEEWGLYRDDLVRSLDQMDASLRVAAGNAAVVDQNEIDDLRSRLRSLRGDVVALVDEPRESLIDARRQVREKFTDTRTKVDAALRRLGHNPDDIARWQDAE